LLVEECVHLTGSILQIGIVQDVVSSLHAGSPVPRLVFLIAGNTRVAESVLRLQVEGELSALAPALPPAERKRGSVQPLLRSRRIISGSSSRPISGSGWR
jgi:hypothetical protein